MEHNFINEEGIKEIKKEKRNVPTKLERITDRSQINIF